MIILDFGSGNTCKNDKRIVERMIDELVKVDTGKHEVVIKWQLFTDCPPNEPLAGEVFEYAVRYAYDLGYKTTASVFDLPSLKYLLEFDIPFVKLANRPDLYWLAGEVPRKIPVFVSISAPCGVTIDDEHSINSVELCCVSKYPATVEEYEAFGQWYLRDGISDHTTDFTLYHKYKPEIYEVHYKLKDSTGPDAGPFARTPQQLAEIL